MSNLAMAYRDAGRMDESIALFEEALRLRELELGPAHPDTIRAKYVLARTYLDVGRAKDAGMLLEPAVRDAKAKLGADHPNTLGALYNLGLVHIETERWDEAIRVLDEVVRLRKAVSGPGHVQTLMSLNALVKAHLGARHWAEAEASAREALALHAKAMPDDWLHYYAMGQLGLAMLEQKKYAEAEPMLVGGYEGLKAREAKISVPARKHIATAASRIVRLYQEWGKSDKAAEWRKVAGQGAAADPKP